MYRNAEDDSESAKSGERDDPARVRVPARVADKALLHVAGVNSFGVAVADDNDLAQINFVDPKALISGVDDPAMVVSSVTQPHRNISTISQRLQLVSDFQRMRVWS